jgi:hypothetical protein
MLKESRYVGLANTMYRKPENHVFTMWQHIALLTIRQYEGKSYNRMFVEWLIEAYYLRLFLGLLRIPHFTTLQKFTDRINNSLLEKIISSFIVISGTKHIFAGIDSTGFKLTRASLHSIILIEQNIEENMRYYLLELMYYNKSYVT